VSFGKQDQLGEGNFGKVFKVKGKLNKEPYALKVLEKKDLDLEDMNQEDLIDLKKEINTLMELDHPNITKYISTYEDSEKFYLLMELAAGGSLTQKIKETQ
jgi:serine/threonine protein kinase